MIVVDTLEDALEENDDETFAVTLSDSDLPSNVALGRATAFATITDANELMVGVEGPLNVAEGSAAVFTVKLTGGTGSDDVVVAYTVTGPTPGPGVDYEVPMGTQATATEVSGKLIIPAGAQSATITILTIADDDTGNNEILTLTLTGRDTNAGEVGPPDTDTDPSAQTTINASDTVTVSVADTRVVEGNRATFRVTLSEPVANATTVTYEVSAAGTPPDFEDTDGTLTIAAGRTTGSITVETLEDTLTEDDETFTVTLALPGTSTNVGNLALGRAVATATITDDDHADGKCPRVDQITVDRGR